MVKENLVISMVIFMRDNGKTTKNMEKEFIKVINIYIKGNLKIIINMDLEFIKMLMEKYTKVNGLMI